MDPNRIMNTLTFNGHHNMHLQFYFVCFTIKCFILYLKILLVEYFQVFGLTGKNFQAKH